MEKTKSLKPFRAVKMMRDIRAKITAETQHMTFAELKAYISQKLGERRPASGDQSKG